RPGTYWLSVYGMTDGLGVTMGLYDVTYWGTAAPPIRGASAKKIDGQPTPVFNQFLFGTGCTGPTGWQSLADSCCIGANDLNFVLATCPTPCAACVAEACPQPG